MKIRFLLTLALALVAASPAWASKHRHHRTAAPRASSARYDAAAAPAYPFADWFSQPEARPRHHEARQSRRTAYRQSTDRFVGGRPADCYGIPWCGCYMRHLVGETNRAYNLARNWAHWGHATSPHVGAIVVWSHHVGRIVGQERGEWIVLSGNDGHAVRERARSLAGAIAFRE